MGWYMRVDGHIVTIVTYGWGAALCPWARSPTPAPALCRATAAPCGLHASEGLCLCQPDAAALRLGPPRRS